MFFLVHTTKGWCKHLCISPNDQGRTGPYIQNASIIEKSTSPGFFNQDQQTATKLISAVPTESTKDLPQKKLFEPKSRLVLDIITYEFLALLRNLGQYQEIDWAFSTKDQRPAIKLISALPI
jgi:hypothetical protein